MASIGKILTPESFLRALHEQGKKQEAALGRGLKKAGLFLQRESQKVVPVDFGNLKASAYTRSVGTLPAPEVIVGYTAAYAAFVHENVAEVLKGQPRPKPHKGLYWGPAGAGSKFLEKPVRQNVKKINQIVADEVKKSKSK